VLLGKFLQKYGNDLKLASFLEHELILIKKLKYLKLDTDISLNFQRKLQKADV